jgi:pimeloyl-ACP methyl ester carboxylesterase
MTLVKILVWILLIYLVYAGFLFAFQRHVLFPRSQIPAVSSPKPDLPLERIWLTTSFGKVEAWLLPPMRAATDGPAPALVFAHGNAELIDFWVDEFSRLTSLGLAVLLVEYPGYGRSEGHPCQDTIAESFMSAYDHLIERTDVDSSRIILMGRSLGGGAVCTLAANRPCAALILMSTFTSVRALAKRFFIPGALVLDPFDNLAVVKSYEGPILVIHGNQDDLIPFHHGQKLSQAARSGRLLIYECRHNDCPPDWNQFRRDLASFLLDIKLIRMPKDFESRH